jgi:flavin-dependent thymidylate synthase
MATIPTRLPETAFPFRSPPPTVRLVRSESAAHPFALTIAAAWSCYGARPASVERVAELFAGNGEATKAARRERAAALYPDLFAAGHHTTFQHAHFVFVLDGVSRLAIWSFFHHHPFYNSEQVSQRYREVTGATMVTPELPEPLAALYRAAMERALSGYRRLVELLTPDMARRYAEVFPARARSQRPEVQERVRTAVQRRAQEVARYVLPLATPAHLYHTVNALTLLRYYALANQLDVPREVRYVVNRMVEEVLAVDPNFLGAPGHPLDPQVLALEDTLEYRALQAVQRRGRALERERGVLPRVRRGARVPTTRDWLPTRPMPSGCWLTRCAPCSGARAASSTTTRRSRWCSTRRATTTWGTRSIWRCTRS